MPTQEELERAEGAAAHDPLYAMRHSTAHVMAEAVQEMFPEAKFAIGPPIKDGFYYDFDLPRALTPEDLPVIEEKMRARIDSSVPFENERWDKARALAYFRGKGQDYKLELIGNIADEDVGIYQQGAFTDLCRGPHVRATSEIGPFKLLSIAGAYWRGDEKRPMLQRVYGTVWPTQEELDRYLWKIEEAKRRDHRKLGRELDLFSFHDLAPGAPFWHPKGMVIFRELEKLWREEHDANGYSEVNTPIMVKKDLWEQSGHWTHYQENMFLLENEGSTFSLKPMNCPEATIIYRSHSRSYRELPLRLSEIGRLHRNERTGTLSGMFRVRQITMDDAHIFCTPDQILAEITSVMGMVRRFYAIFGLTPTFYLSTRPEKAMGEVTLWREAEAALASALEANGMAYQVKPGEGAFYGPKIDIDIEDALERAWQVATIQLDFLLPERFDLEYTDADGQAKRPVMIHRAIFGSFERFIGILVEQFSGAFPVWLAPVQAVLIPIADRHAEYAERVAAQLRAAGMRVQVDSRREKMQHKIREAQMQKVPYMLIVGDKEIEANAVAVRLRTEENRGPVPVADFLDKATDLIRARSLDL